MRDIQELLSKAREKIKDFDVIIDPLDSTYVWVSDKLCDLFGYAAEELIGTQLQNYQKDKSKDTREVELEMLDCKSCMPVNLVVKRKDGGKIDIKGEGLSFECNKQIYLVGKILESVDATNAPE